MNGDSELDNCNTLGELIALRHTVTAVCGPCNRYRLLDLVALSQRYGSAARIRRVALLLRCDQCGGRDRQIVVQPRWLPH